MKLINRLRNAEIKILCIWIDVFRRYQGDDFNEFFNVLRSLKKVGQN